MSNAAKKEASRSELIIEMTRSFMSLYYNHNMVMGKGSKPVTPQDFWKLPYDKENEEPEQSKEEREEQMKVFMEKAKKRIKKNG